MLSSRLCLGGRKSDIFVVFVVVCYDRAIYLDLNASSPDYHHDWNSDCSIY